MTPNADAALSEAFRLVHLALRMVGDWLAAGLTRAVAGEARRVLQRGEAALRRATLLLAGEMEPIAAPKPAPAGNGSQGQTVPTEHSMRPRALALMEPLPRGGGSGGAFPSDLALADPFDPVDPTALAARLDRLRRAFTDPIGRARRMRRLLDRRRRQRPLLRPGPPPGRPRGPDRQGWRASLDWIDGAARDVLLTHPPPG